MRETPNGWACDRHGAPEPDRPQRASVTPLARPSRPKRTPPARVSTQTQRLKELQSVIVARNQEGESLATIAADLWQQLGYANEYVAASKISRFLRLRGVPVVPRNGPPPGTQPRQRFSEERLAEVRAALAAGVTVWAFAGAHWQEWGFRSRVACDSVIRGWLRTKP
jgi:hypothetical protein